MRTVHSLYQPIFNWIEARRNRQPFFVGVNGPQGAGKSTLCHWLVKAYSQQGIRAHSFSIDDFYLTRDEQVRLAKQHAANPYLQQRGYPGTHDISLGAKTLAAVRSLSMGQSLRVPSYNKSAFSGLGDRAPEADWNLLSGPLDVVFVEGWMLGFQSQDSVTDPHLNFCDQKLRDYQSWLNQLDAFIYLKPREIDYVVAWRVEAEERMKASGRAGMSTEQVRHYVEKFLPAYRLWRDSINARALAPRPYLELEILADRLPPGER